MNKEKEVEAYLKGVLPEEQKLKYEIAQELGILDKVLDGKACQQKKPAGSEVCLQVNEKKKKICETQKKYKKASSGSCCGRCFFGILIVAGIEYGCNIQEKNMGNLQNSYVKLDKVSKIYKMGEVEIRAVDNISFEISKGEFVVVVGPSGAGKTTVLNILGGMDRG